MGGEVTLKLPFILGHIDDGLVDNQGRDDAIEEKKLKNDQGDVTSKSKNASTSIEEINSCKNDDDTGANGIKTIEKCRNENGVSIDVVVEDLSDRKNDTKDVEASQSATSKKNNYSETERNINVVTAQIHSSAI